MSTEQCNKFKTKKISICQHCLRKTPNLNEKMSEIKTLLSTLQNIQMSTKQCKKFKTKNNIQMSTLLRKTKNLNVKLSEIKTNKQSKC